MKSRPTKMIDLTGHLKDLRGSLSPAAPDWKRKPSSEPHAWIMRLFIAFLVINAAILTAYLVACR